MCHTHYMDPVLSGSYWQRVHNVFVVPGDVDLQNLGMFILLSWDLTPLDRISNCYPASTSILHCYVVAPTASTAAVAAALTPRTGEGEERTIEGVDERTSQGGRASDSENAVIAAHEPCNVVQAVQSPCASGTAPARNVVVRELPRMPTSLYPHLQALARRHVTSSSPRHRTVKRPLPRCRTTPTPTPTAFARHVNSNTFYISHPPRHSALAPPRCPLPRHVTPSRAATSPAPRCLDMSPRRPDTPHPALPAHRHGDTTPHLLYIARPTPPRHAPHTVHTRAAHAAPTSPSSSPPRHTYAALNPRAPLHPRRRPANPPKWATTPPFLSPRHVANTPAHCAQCVRALKLPRAATSCLAHRHAAVPTRACVAKSKPPRPPAHHPQGSAVHSTRAHTALPPRHHTRPPPPPRSRARMHVTQGHHHTVSPHAVPAHRRFAPAHSAESLQFK
ncbi:hypothetical protein FA95DRAFT_1578232 [Auriscalpium vulgare]|uniref:Uncharacterized protein n=1 Tax=Auriscalpium vulgare TaxID=40419 RepID=A0ACB8R320_9AGAM|nr:hypothetical protein FA95DRAFT_1578232 [Auriscalpium vulgare]